MPMQTHCHLALTLGITPEFAPIYKWRATEAIAIPGMIGTLHVGLTGRMTPFQVFDGANPAAYTMWNLRLIVEAEESLTVVQREAAIAAMFGRKALYVEHDHNNNGTSHTSQVKTVYVQDIGAFEPIAQSNYSRFYVNIQLREGIFIP